MRMAINDQGHPVILDENGTTLGRVKSIIFPTVTIPTLSGDVHEIDRARSIYGDVELNDGRRFINVELPIRS